MPIPQPPSSVSSVACHEDTSRAHTHGQSDSQRRRARAATMQPPRGVVEWIGGPCPARARDHRSSFLSASPAFARRPASESCSLAALQLMRRVPRGKPRARMRVFPHAPVARRERDPLVSLHWALAPCVHGFLLRRLQTSAFRLCLGLIYVALKF